MSGTLDRVLTALATSPRSRALGFCDLGGSLRLAPITPFLRFGDGSHFDGSGDSHAIREGIARASMLDGARGIAHRNVSRRHCHIHPGAWLPAAPFFANILDQVTPDANHA